MTGSDENNNNNTLSSPSVVRCGYNKVNVHVGESPVLLDTTTLVVNNKHEVGANHHLDKNPTNMKTKSPKATPEKKSIAIDALLSLREAIVADTLLDDDDDDDANNKGPLEQEAHAVVDEKAPKQHVTTNNDDLDYSEGNPRGFGCYKRQCRRKLSTRTQRPETAQTTELHLYPSDIELNSATEHRARAALETWYEKYRELIEFKKANCHCNVPQKYFLSQSLGVWVNKQRMEKKFLDEGKKTSMTQQKLQALEKIGFVWTLQRKGQHGWDEKYEQLKAFKRAHGHCKVPTRYADNTALGRWVSTQRADYKSYKAGKPTFMMEEKIAKLEAVGFVWNAA